MTAASKSFALAVVLQALLKLWLVHGHEITARDYPYDDPWYVIAATNWYWWGSFADGAFSRSAAYPLWIAISGLAGQPLRLSTEYLGLAAAALLAVSLVRAGVPRTVAALAFGAVIFHPFSVAVNDFVVSESLYGPVLVASVAGMVSLLASRGTRATLVWTGLCLGILCQTRPEGAMLVTAQIVVFAIVALWVARETRREITIAILGMAAVAFAVTLGVRTANYAAFDAFADYQLAMPGFAGAQRSLRRIIPDRPRTWVGVPKESLQRAYDVSPTLATLRPYFEGEGKIWESYGPESVGAEHEIAGLLGWPLAAAVRWTKPGMSGKDFDTFGRRIADEIDPACASGRLRCTPARLASLYLAWRGLPHTPAWFVQLGGELVAPPVPLPFPATEVRPLIVATFDLAANRRAGLLASRSATIGGWAANPPDALESVSFRDRRGRIVATTRTLLPRSDLDGAFGERRRPGEPALLAGFELAVPLPVEGGRMTFAFASGNVVELGYREWSNVRLAQMRSTAERSVMYAIETRSFPPVVLADSALEWTLLRYSKTLYALSIAAAGALLVVALCGRFDADRLRYGIILLLAGVIAARVVLLVVFAATVWPVMEARFLYPVAGLYAVALLMLVSCGVARLRERWSGSRSGAATRIP